MPCGNKEEIDSLIMQYFFVVRRSVIKTVFSFGVFCCRAVKVGQANRLELGYLF